MIGLASVTEIVAAPAAAVWAIVADFVHPQRLASTITACEVQGDGPGAVRTVHARGLVIHERLVEADEWAGRFRYEILPSGDMPAEGLVRYMATVALRPLGAASTEVEWSSRGEVAGDPGPISAMLTTLYQGAIAKIRTLTAPAAPEG